MEYPRITYTMTTGKRFNLFYRTMKSFMETCEDKDLIDRWIISDDGSNQTDLKNMKDMYPFFEVYAAPYHGQNNNLNFLFNKVETEWFFHGEDDWLYLKRDHYIRKMFDVINTDPKIKNITLRPWIGDIRCLPETDVYYNIHHYKPGAGSMKSTNCEWFGYSLNPGLQNKPLLDHFGPYPSEFNGKGAYARYWDRTHAQQYMEEGYTAANLVGPYIEHIGWEDSTYGA